MTVPSPALRVPLPAEGLPNVPGRPIFAAKGNIGFTLVEVLVSTAVLLLLIAVVAQLVSSATLVTTGSRKRMDADAQARLVLDRLAMDIAGMVKRADVDYLFSKQEGNDKMFFYGESPGFFPGDARNRSRTALIGYRVNANHQLERLGKSLAWHGATTGAEPGGMVFLTYPAATSPSPSPTPYPASQLAGNWPTALGTAPQFEGTDPDYYVLADQVFRFEFCFQLEDGSYANRSPTTAGSAETHRLEGISAIVVALAILDPASRRLAPADLARLADELPDPDDAGLSNAEPVLMAQAWQAAVNAPEFASRAGLPPMAASQVRIYQRVFRLEK